MSFKLSKTQKLRRASLLYHKVRRSVTKELDHLGIELTTEERTRLISAVYTGFKGMPVRKALVRDIRAKVAERYQPEKDVSSEKYFNPLKLDIDALTGIPWWELDEFLSTSLPAMVTPLNVRFEVNAGDALGSTSIMSLYTPTGAFNYEYLISGVSRIVENLRKDVENKSGPEWMGAVKVRPGKKDDGKASSYFIQFLLADVNGDEIPPSKSYEEAEFPMPEPSPDDMRKRRKKVIEKEEDLESRRKRLQKEKGQRQRKRPEKKEPPKPEPSPEPPKKEKPSKKVPKTPEREVETSADRRAKNVERVLELQGTQLKDLERLFRDGLLTKKEFLDERRSVMQQTSDAIAKFEKGGKI